MDYQAFVRRQHNKIFAQYAGSDAPKGGMGWYGTSTAFIGVPDLEWMLRYRPLIGIGGGGLSPFPAPREEAFVWRGRDGESELWVKAEDKAVSGTGPYASHWATFCSLQGVTGAPGPLNGRPMVIDHLFPETTAARRGIAFVRLVPVDARSNSLVGSTTEKFSAGQSGPKRPRTATGITMAKVSGFQESFRKAKSGATISQQLTAHLASEGYTFPADMRINVEHERELLAWLINVSRGVR